MNLTNKNVLVFGSGISGIGAADLLAAVGANPIIYDENTTKDFNIIFNNLLKDCREFDYLEYENKSLFNKLIDGFARLLSAIL